VHAPPICESPEVTGARLRKGAGRARRPQGSDDRLLRPYGSTGLRCRFGAVERPRGRLAALDFSHLAPRVAADEQRLCRVNQPALTAADPHTCGFDALGSAASAGRREPADWRWGPLALDPEATLQ
jgi:hypothetical protein